MMLASCCLRYCMMCYLQALGRKVVAMMLKASHGGAYPGLMCEPADLAHLFSLGGVRSVVYPVSGILNHYVTFLYHNGEVSF